MSSPKSCHVLNHVKVQNHVKVLNHVEVLHQVEVHGIAVSAKGSYPKKKSALIWTLSKPS